MTSTVRVNPLTPTEADLVKYRQRLHVEQHRHAYATGVLGAIIGLLAADHAGCTKRNCDTCRQLRWGLAVNTVLDEYSRQLIGGAE